MLKRYIIGAVVAVGLAVTAISAVQARTCTTSCFGNSCTTTCF